MVKIQNGPLQVNHNDENIPEFFRKYKKDILETSKFFPIAEEHIKILKKTNFAMDWEQIYVTDKFNPQLVQNCEFRGTVYIGDLEEGFLEHEGLQLPIGLYNSTIISSFIQNNTAIRNVKYMSRYIIEDQCLLFNIDQLTTSVKSNFGHGFIHSSQTDDDRLWLEIANENGGRGILPFKDMLPADAFIWAGFRDDDKLLKRFIEMTDQLYDDLSFTTGRIGKQSSITNCRIISDVIIGPNASIQGANKLQNLTIQSSLEEPAHIGIGVELINGIVGYQNHIEYDVKAINFLTGRNVHLEYGARFINSIVGPNSTIACCEVLSNLLFPFHEQHHNNSFLIASTVMGQSNIAAGATIGSNHNSRAADGEIIAKRGFWPGLVTNFKHNCFFASFCLIAKGNYYSELNISLPFTLVSPSADLNAIQLFPGFWFKYNMYALARNSWKFGARDKRRIKAQHIETDYLAPDTVEEMFAGIEALHTAIEKAAGRSITLDEIEENHAQLDKELKVFLDGQINKGRALVIKAAQGLSLFRMMIKYYASRALLTDIKTKIETGMSFDNAVENIRENIKPVESNWENAGGQLVPASDLNRIFIDVKNGSINSWQDLHSRYDELWHNYPAMKQAHGLYSIVRLYNIKTENINTDLVIRLLTEAKAIAGQLADWAYESREKDYSSEFRRMTFRSEKEMIAVTGNIEDNSFLSDYKQDMEKFTTDIDRIIK